MDYDLYRQHNSKAENAEGKKNGSPVADLELKLKIS
jgi:hypothetical protein